jgi:hypothetical protein
LLGLSTLVAAAGTALGAVAMLILLSYGVLRGSQVIWRGEGTKRFALGAGVLLFTLFACFDYLLSTNNWPVRHELHAATNLSYLYPAEATFKSEGKLDENKNKVSEYGTVPQLVQAGLINEYNVYYGSGVPQGAAYRHVLLLSSNPAENEKGFFVYATPTDYGPGESALWRIVPGGSWVNVLRPRSHRARRTFAADQSGVVREADLGSSRPVTREEAETWKTWQQ